MPEHTSFKEYVLAHYAEPFCATDAIIRYKKDGLTGIVLIKRRNFPHGLALPGGFAEPGINFIQNTIKEAKEETGLDIVIDEPHDVPFTVLSDPKQDPRAHIISVAYTAVGYGTLKPQEGEDALQAYHLTRSNIRLALQKDLLAFDHHRKILWKYLEQWK